MSSLNCIYRFFQITNLLKFDPDSLNFIFRCAHKSAILNLNRKYIHKINFISNLLCKCFAVALVLTYAAQFIIYLHLHDDSYYLPLKHI